MKKLSKGAISMVLAGAVTFSVTNALLVERLAAEHSLIIFGDQRKADVTQKKMEKNQTLETNVNDGQKKQKLSDKMAASQVAVNKKNESDMAKEAIHSNNENTTKADNKNTTTTITTVAATRPVTSVKTPKTPPTVPATPGQTSIPTQTASPTQTDPPTKPGITKTSASKGINNNGQEVSEAAKEEAESRQDNKKNNGKKM
jgi:hypothetical protein